MKLNDVVSSEYLRNLLSDLWLLSEKRNELAEELKNIDEQIKIKNDIVESIEKLNQLRDNNE